MHSRSSPKGSEPGASPRAGLFPEVALYHPLASFYYHTGCCQPFRGPSMNFTE
jgi:hypothetical protein